MRALRGLFSRSGCQVFGSIKDAGKAFTTTVTGRADRRSHQIPKLTSFKLCKSKGAIFYPH